MRGSLKPQLKVYVTALGHVQDLLGRKEVEVTPKESTVMGVIESLSNYCGRSIKDSIVDRRSGELKVLILLNDLDVHFLEKTKTSVKHGDRLTILPLAAGG
ncbi:MAG: MoaD/ThiS family protein [Candidatus Bathyarchaeia archaeon]